MIIKVKKCLDCPLLHNGEYIFCQHPESTKENDSEVDNIILNQGGEDTPNTCPLRKSSITMEYEIR